jgi:predicted XRE-type DNA-binding protein
MLQKRIDAHNGIVSSDRISTIFQREIFFPVDPITLDWIDGQELKELFPSGMNVAFDVEQYLDYLPPLEQEIVFLLYVRRKNQKDAAALLKVSQPTVSYRYRRALKKLSYLAILTSVDTRTLTDEIPFRRPEDREVFRDLLFYTNQGLVGKKHNIRQTSVKWIFTKVKRQVADLEIEDPHRWWKHYALLMLLERNLGSRIQHDDSATRKELVQ